MRVRLPGRGAGAGAAGLGAETAGLLHAKQHRPPLLQEQEPKRSTRTQA